MFTFWSEKQRNDPMTKDGNETITKSDLARIRWSAADTLIWKLLRDWDTSLDLGDSLGIEGILIEQVPPVTRFMLEHWLQAMRRLDEHIRELADIAVDISMDMEEAEKE
jgi:hypothetical protein